LNTFLPEADVNNNNTANIMSRRQVAEFLGICRTTLDRLDIPRTKIGRRVVFKREALDKWIDDHTEKEMREYV